MKVPVKIQLHGDPIIWAIAFILSGLSMLTVYSASSSLAYKQMHCDTEYYLIRQAMLIGVGLAAMWLVHRIDYRYYAALAKAALWLSIPLLLLTWRYGLKLNDASRWLHIPFINKSFQPSDLAQLSLIIRLAYSLSKQKKKVASFRASCLPMLTWSGLISSLIALTNCSAAILLFITCLVLMYIGRTPMQYLLIILLAGSVVGGSALMLGQRGKTAVKRIECFFKGELSFQAEQAYIAIAKGGVTGQGPGKSTQRNFLPHPYSDFIYAILIEEYGLVGALCVMGIYMILFYRAVVLLPTAASYYGGILAVGICLLLVLQASLNMAVVVGLGPVTGLPLPFVSMGGTSMLFTGIALGIMLSISQGVIDKKFLLFKQEAEGIRCNRYKKNIAATL